MNLLLGPYASYIKLAGLGVLLAIIAGSCWHLGGLGPKAQLAQFQARQAELTATAVLAERASAQAERDRDHNTELTHAKVIVQIDAAPTISTPVLLCEPASKVSIGPVPGAKGEAGSVATDPTTGGGKPVDRTVNIRPAAEELKKRLEKIMADYRQEDQEWPHETQAQAP